MAITRRDFLKASAVVAGAVGLSTAGFPRLREASANAVNGLPMIWLQGQGCTGCSVSLLNSIYYDTIDSLLINTLDMKYNSTVMASAGSLAVSAAEAARAKGGYVLAVEGAIPTGAGGAYARLWPGMTVLQGVKTYAANAKYVVAVGTCAAYGGIPGALPNPTGAVGVSKVVTGKPIINIPGCPANPDWVVGTIAFILKNGKPPELDSTLRPKDYFAEKVHEKCPRKEYYEERRSRQLSEFGCLRNLGCKGPETRCDCPKRAWNSPAKGVKGVSWCIVAGAPCHGCTESGFPDKFSPFYPLESALTAPCGEVDEEDAYSEHEHSGSRGGLRRGDD